MVKTRTGNPNSDLMRIQCGEILTILGQTITRISITETEDQQGRLSGTSESTSTFTGDIQFLTKDEKELLGYGHQDQGLAKLFCKHNQTLNLEEEILVDSRRYEVVKLIDEPEFGGDSIFKQFLVQRRDQTS